jgi:ATP-dependent RNA helicase RhlE
MPIELEDIKTPFSEKQEQMREIDRQKKLEDPDFKGAFHQKKWEINKQKSKRK